jgi:hypothetical protein
VIRTFERKKSSSRAGAAARPVRPPPAVLQSAGAALQRSCACGGSCPRCAPASSIRIGAHNDDFEREADAVADRVMRMPTGEVSVRSVAPALQRKCAACEEEDEEHVLRPKRASSGAGSGTVSAPTTHVRAVLSSPGQLLPADTRAFFEPRFGVDFSEVRLHSDSHAHESAREVHARAFTVGTNIVFGSGEYSPGTQEGRRLLAHELTHVVQQAGQGVSSLLQRQGRRRRRVHNRYRVHWLRSAV